MQTIDKKIIPLKLIYRFIALLFLTALFIAGGGALIYYEVYTLTTVLLITLMGVLELMMLVFTFVFSFLYHHTYRYEIQPDRITVISGVFFRNQDLIPIYRIQHVEITQNLIERALGLSSIVIYTAGSNQSITGLTPTIAENLIKTLKGYLDERIKNKELMND